MPLAPHEFIRRFLLHVLPKGLHRIRHYGLCATGAKAENLAKMRALLDVSPSALEKGDDTATSASTEETPAQLHIAESQIGRHPKLSTRAVIIRLIKSGSLHARHRT